MRAIFLGLLMLLPFDLLAIQTVRIKDIVSVEGIRENLLVGYGLVVGLNGTGDNLGNTDFTKKGLTEFLNKMGVNIQGGKMDTKNVAAVTVTATLPPFARQGSKIDIAVSTMGSAKSLAGGTLVATPLVGPDGEVYAVGQGSISIGGFTASGQNATVSKGVATNGFISNGAIIEKEVDFDLNSLNTVNLSLNNPDITTSINIAQIINERMNDNVAIPKDPTTVTINVPSSFKDNVVGLLAQIEPLEVEPDNVAKIVIEESSGTIVIGDNVRISPVAIAQGNLTVMIAETPANNPLNNLTLQNDQNSIANQINNSTLTNSQGAQSGENTGATNSQSVSNTVNNQTQAASSTTLTQTQTPTSKATNINVQEGEKGSQIRMLKAGSTLKELVDGLNSLGVTPRDLITILQNIKVAGALQAEIETR